MNVENFDFLKNQVKFTGFGESLENDLRSNMEKQEDTFQLTHPHEFGKDQTTATLHFRKSDQNMYFFNSYHLSVKPHGVNDPIERTFYVGKDNTYTLKEAYNLLSGRAVNKDLVNREGKDYNAWVQLDFKDTDHSGNYKLKPFTENYGYDLEETLGKLPIKELATTEDKAKLIESLKKGNLQSVIFLNDGNEQKRFIEANPQFKAITIYDDNMKRIRVDQKEGNNISQSAKKERTQKAGQAETTLKSGEKKSRKKRQAI
ncbi:MAG TPA: hypothetical protein VHA56_12535 [Mucilaginibacter sp.]|nr:hypothetical protein [Mucilaginibacter sp.]